MLANMYDQLTDIPEFRERRCKMLGVGAGAPTKVFGAGVKTITRVSAGDYKLTYSETPGKYLDASYGLESTAMTDLKGFTIIFKPFDTTNLVLEFTLFNAAGTATDLAAAQWITVYAEFTFTGMTLL
jgi:hypothetical protein